MRPALTTHLTFMCPPEIIFPPPARPPAPAPPDAFDGGAKTSQNRRVSSPAPDTTVRPSGEAAMCRTREVCPVSSFVFTMEGYFQRHSWFSA